MHIVHAMASASGSGVPPSEESTQERDLSDLPHSEEHTEYSHCQVRSILDVLKCPQASTLGRKQAFRSNPPPVGAKKSKGIPLKSDPKSVSPSDRIKDFPDECLKVNFNKQLFCNACREVLSCKKSLLQTHIKTSKHEKGKERLK